MSVETSKGHTTATAKTNTEVFHCVQDEGDKRATADPYGMKERRTTAKTTAEARLVVERFERCAGVGGVAGPSTALRSAQDDRFGVGWRRAYLRGDPRLKPWATSPFFGGSMRPEVKTSGYLIVPLRRGAVERSSIPHPLQSA